MNLTQIEWVLERALFITKKYKSKKLTDKDFEEVVAYINKVYADSKQNEFCKMVMFKILDSLEE